MAQPWQKYVRVLMTAMAQGDFLPGVLCDRYDNVQLDLVGGFQMLLVYLWKRCVDEDNEKVIEVMIYDDLNVTRTKWASVHRYFKWPEGIMDIQLMPTLKGYSCNNGVLICLYYWVFGCGEVTGTSLSFHTKLALL